jgi:hypothetical protein
MGAGVPRSWTVGKSEHQALNTSGTEIWSTRVATGGPPIPNTAEPDGLRGNHARCDSAPNRTTRGSPNAAAACAGPVSTEIML